jgi:hypothetical protein
MAFTQPDFNLNVAFWRFGRWPANPPDVFAIGNLSPGRLQALDAFPATMYLRVPKGTDCQDGKNNVGVDTCECPYLSGRFYQVVLVDDIGGGFTNEHRLAVLFGIPTWPIPFPPVGGFTPIVPPSAPVFLTAFSSLPGGSAGFTFSPTSLGGSIGGCIVTFNDLFIPIVTINGGANCVRNGALISQGVAPGIGPGMVIYPFLDLGIVGVNAIHVQSGGLGLQLFSGYAFAGMGTGTAIVGEGAATGAFGPPIIAPYASNPVHPNVHMAYACGQNPFGVQGWVLPFNLVGAGGGGVAAGTPVNLWAGLYLAAIGGQFPAQGTGSVNTWVAIQSSYLP